MSRRAIVTSISSNNQVRVMFPDLNNNIDYPVQKSQHVYISVGDLVVVDYFGASMADGLIIANIKESSTEPSSDLTFVHTQISANSEWYIEHNMNKRPSVTVVDSANNTVIGDVQYIDDNTVIVTFTGSFSGYAYLN